jgi:hypothetical protein
LGQALNATNLTWTTGGNAPWNVETNFSLDGLAAGNGAFTGTNQVNWIQTTVSGPCRLTFWWGNNADTYTSNPNLLFQIGGTNELSLPAGYYEAYSETEWIDIPAGSQTLTWSCSFSNSNVIPYPAADTCAVDEVTVLPAGYPIITSQPANQETYACASGACVSFSVQAVTTPAVNYQWRFNGTNLSNQTNATLALNTYFTTNMTGEYSVVVSNAAGIVVSSNALLTVFPNPLGAALDAPQFVWTTSCQAPWTGQVAGGGASAYDYADFNYDSPLETTMTGPGLLSFSYVLEPFEEEMGVSPYYYGFMYLAIDGTNQWQVEAFAYDYSPISGQEFLDLPPGTHTLTWTMDSYSATLSQVQLAPPGPPMFLTAPPSQAVPMRANVRFSAAAVGDPMPTFQWYLAGQALAGATNDSLSLASVQAANAGQYYLVASNSYGAVPSSSATLTVLPAVGYIQIGDWSSYGGSAGRITVAGTTAYVAAGSGGLAIYDISNPFDPALVFGGFIGGNTGANDITVVGNYAYLANGYLSSYNGPPPYGGNQSAGSYLDVADVSDPSNPAVIGQVNVASWYAYSGGTGRSSALVQRLTQFGSRLYFDDQISGLNVFDLSSPTNPILLWSQGYTIGGNYLQYYPDSVAVTNQEVFLEDAGLLHILNASVPTNVVTLGAFSNVVANDIHLAGPYAYVAAGSAGLAILNVSNLASPVLVGSNIPANANAVEVIPSGNYAYVADANLGLLVMDITTPSQPVLVGKSVVFGQAAGLQLVGTDAYVTDSKGGLQVFDVSTPSEPELEGLSSPPVGDAVAVQVTNEYAYLADSEVGLHILDVSVPSQPVWQGSYPSAGQVQDVKLAGLYAYLAAGSAGLEIVNVADPTDPLLAGTYAAATNAQCLQLVGQEAFVADGAGGLQIINVHSAAHPMLAGEYSAVNFVSDVKVVGSYAYLADGSNGLVILNVSNVAKPAMIGACAAAAYATRLDVAGQYAYALVGNYLEIIDITAPANPSLVSSLNLYGANLSVSGQNLLVCNGNGIAVVNIANPALPVQVGTLSVGNSYGVFLSGDYAYSAAGSSGLVIAQFGQLPFITTQPASQMAAVGTNVSFSVAASGFAPITYQWVFNGSNLLTEATNADLLLSNAQSAEVGSYTVALSNLFGSVTSFPATLSLSAPPPVFEDGSLKSANGTFSFTWTAATGISYQVQYTSNLAQNIWVNLGTPVTASGGTATASDAMTNSHRYYRIVVPP